MYINRYIRHILNSTKMSIVATLASLLVGLGLRGGGCDDLENSRSVRLPMGGGPGRCGRYSWSVPVESTWSVRLGSTRGRYGCPWEVDLGGAVGTVGRYPWNRLGRYSWSVRLGSTCGRHGWSALE